MLKHRSATCKVSAAFGSTGVQHRMSRPAQNAASRLVLLLTSAIIASDVHGQTDATTVYAWCRRGPSNNEAACLAYLTGIYDGAMTYWARNVAIPREAAGGRRSMHDAPACLPDPAPTHEQIGDIYMGYIASHPGRGKDLAGSVLLDALYEAFPCRK